VEYRVRACSPGDLTAEELASCLELVKDVRAAGINFEKLCHARLLAVARASGTIVGVGRSNVVGRDAPLTSLERGDLIFRRKLPSSAILR
jgi:hypothetical protein